jgi:hypothetical protein
MAQWVAALVEGLAGVRDRSSLLRHVLLEPRWEAAGVHSAQSVDCCAASCGYLAYRYALDPERWSMVLLVTGSGQEVQLRALLPEGWRGARMSTEGRELDVHTETEERSRYAVTRFPRQGVMRIELSST